MSFLSADTQQVECADFRRWVICVGLPVLLLGCQTPLGGAFITRGANFQIVGEAIDAQTGQLIESVRVDVVDTGLLDLKRGQERPVMYSSEPGESSFEYEFWYGWCNYEWPMWRESTGTFTISVRADNYEEQSSVIRFDDHPYEEGAYTIKLGAIQMNRIADKVD